MPKLRAGPAGHRRDSMAEAGRECLLGHFLPISEARSTRNLLSSSNRALIVTRSQDSHAVQKPETTISSKVPTRSHQDQRTCSGPDAKPADQLAKAEADLSLRHGVRPAGHRTVQSRILLRAPSHKSDMHCRRWASHTTARVATGAKV